MCLLKNVYRFSTTLYSIGVWTVVFTLGTWIGCDNTIVPGPNPESTLVWNITNPCFPDTDTKLFMSWDDPADEAATWPTHYDPPGTYTIVTACKTGDAIELAYSPAPYARIWRVNAPCAFTTETIVAMCDGIAQGKP